MGALTSLVLHWGGYGSPGFAGTALGRLWEPWLHWYCTGDGSPGFTGTALGRLWEPWHHWYCTEKVMGALALLVLHWGAAGALSSLVLHWGAVGALALLVLHWGGCGSPGFTGNDASSLGIMTGCLTSSSV